jgi:Fission yeast centromere protein N-terminal domain
MPLTSLLTPVMLPASSSSSKKRRRAITNTEKIEIRKYYFDKTHNKRPTLSTLQKWYKDKHPHLPVSISSLEKFISAKYNTLNNLNVTVTSNQYQ